MTGFVTSVAFDPVRNRVLAASIDGRVGVWDAATGHSRAGGNATGARSTR
jgi:hypothetical protein